MRRKAQEDKVVNALLDAITEIRGYNREGVDIEVSKKEEDEIVDIITFCNNPKYLDLPSNNFHLRMSQKVMLKCFYIGTRGNEKLKLDKEEWEWLYSQKGDEIIGEYVYKKNIDAVIEKLHKKEKENFNFRELHLVLGRRGGKTILASVISAYEVYKLLAIGGGNPHRFYNLPSDDEIAVINVALSEKQAGRLFAHIQSRLRNGPFFKGRIAKETTTEIRLFTDSDLKKKAANPVLSVPGSILILCGHSNPDSLAGYNAILLLFDELAFYDDTGKVTGQYFYDRLKPSLSHFYEYGEGRLVEISSPSSPAGVFYQIHRDSEEYDDILSFQLPTWCSNPTFHFDHPELRRDRQRNPEAFATEYGAQWAKTGVYGNYFPEGLVERCIRPELVPHDRPMPEFNYYLHVDPANGGDRYVAVLVGAQRYVDTVGKKRWKVHLAHTWVWEPEVGVGLLYNLIDKDVIGICELFRPLWVTYDQWNSIQSLQLLRSRGIRCMQTAYNRAYKSKIYQNLTDMMSYNPEPELLLYEDVNLVLEMKTLKKRRTLRGFSIITDKHGDIKTDDIIDCLAGATSMASGNVREPLPLSVTAYTGMR